MLIDQASCLEFLLQPIIGGDVRLTKNFTLAEFEHSQVATRLGIDNRIPVALLGNINRLAKWLQIFRDRLSIHQNKDVPIYISSGYRCRRLNIAIDGDPNSKHIQGLAVDIWTPELLPQELVFFVCQLMQDQPFDQIINEFDKWVHIGLSLTNSRYEYLKATWHHTVISGMQKRYTRIEPLC